MKALGRLFGRSPFAPLQTHMECVGKCVHMLSSLFQKLKAGDQKGVEAIAKKISKREHEADLVKNDIRSSLKGHLFLPVARLRLLEILSLQDGIADTAEDVGVLLTFRKLPIPDELAELFEEFLNKNLETFDAVFKIILELTEILESTFGGKEAEKLRLMVDHVAYLEHQVDLIQRALLKDLFAHEEVFSFATFHLWMRVVEELSNISNLSEKLANRVLVAMETK